MMDNNALGAARTLAKLFGDRESWATVKGKHPNCEGRVYIEGDLDGHFSGYFDGGIAIALTCLPQICRELVKLAEREKDIKDGN
jgi:hypothetical protein